MLIADCGKYYPLSFGKEVGAIGGSSWMYGRWWNVRRMVKMMLFRINLYWHWYWLWQSRSCYLASAVQFLHPVVKHWANGKSQAVIRPWQSIAQRSGSCSLIPRQWVCIRSAFRGHAAVERASTLQETFGESGSTTWLNAPIMRVAARQYHPFVRAHDGSHFGHSGVGIGSTAIDSRRNIEVIGYLSTGTGRLNNSEGASWGVGFVLLGLWTNWKGRRAIGEKQNRKAEFCHLNFQC